jgi:molecular chaperone GrpE
MSDTKQTVGRSEIEEHEADSPGSQGPGAPAPEDGAPRTDDGAPRTGDGCVAGGGTAEAPGGDATAIEGDLDELVKTAAERDEYLALAQRTQADFENYRKRVGKEAAHAQKRGVASLAKELLPALDNLDRALEEAVAAAAGGASTAGAAGGGRSAGAAGDGGTAGAIGSGGPDPLLEGVRLVRSELVAGLARAGIESFSPLGEAFDPAVHEAMATVEQPPGGAESGTVVEVYQPGYRLGESVIRPARVVVAA